MTQRLRSLLLLLLFSSRAWSTEIPTDVSKTAKPATIKILIGKELPSAILEVKGHYQVVNPSNDIELATGVMNKRRSVEPHPEGIKWGELFPSIHQMRIVPMDAQTSLLVNGIQYRGCIEIYQVDGKLQLINELDIESYLKAILTTQFPKQNNKEVLEAIAVVARTNAYYLASRNSYSFWHVDGKEVGYQGYGVTLQNLYIDAAVDQTRNVILTYKNAPFAATWTVDSAGKTAPFSSIFRKNIPTPSGVQSPVAAKARNKHSWSFSLPINNLASLGELNRINEIQTFREKLSNKVYAIRLKGEEGHKDIDFFTLQKELGADKLRSNDFTVTLQGESVLFKGHGEGHGVELCLYSALIMAQEGIHAKQILQAFFPHTQVHIADNSGTEKRCAPL